MVHRRRRQRQDPGAVVGLIPRPRPGGGRVERTRQRGPRGAHGAGTERPWLCRAWPSQGRVAGRPGCDGAGRERWPGSSRASPARRSRRRALPRRPRTDRCRSPTRSLSASRPARPATAARPGPPTRASSRASAARRRATSTPRSESLEMSGGLLPMQNWYAPALNAAHEAGVADWDVADVVALLMTGCTAPASVPGPMAEGVYRSTQYVDDADRRAMAAACRPSAPNSTTRGSRRWRPACAPPGAMRVSPVSRLQVVRYRQRRTGRGARPLGVSARARRSRRRRSRARRRTPWRSASRPAPRPRRPPGRGRSRPRPAA